MYNPGWGPATLRGLYRLMTRTHQMRIRVQMMDLNNGFLGDIPAGQFLDGSVDIDADADVTRSLTMTLLDPFGTLNLDTANPAYGAMYLDRMVQVWYCIAEVGSSVWYEIPVFTGPISKVDRNGPILQVEGQGKEIMARNVAWSARTYAKGHSRIDVARDLLRTAGEANSHIRMQGNSSRTSSPTVLGREIGFWGVARMTLNNANMNLFYDGRGVAQGRNRTTKPVWTFEDDSLLSPPQSSMDLDSLINAADVTGAVPKGAKKPVRFRYVAPRAHPLSPWSLGRNGAPRVVPEYVQDDKYKTVAQCRAAAVSIVNRGLLQTVDTKFDTFPNPLIEEYDYITVKSSLYYGTFQVRKYSLPLGPEGSMSINRLQRTSPRVLSRKFRSLA